MRTNVRYENHSDGNASVFSDEQLIGKIIKHLDFEGQFVYVPEFGGPYSQRFASKPKALRFIRDLVSRGKRSDLEDELVQALNAQEPLAVFLVSLVERIEKLEDELNEARKEIGRTQSNGGWSQGLPPER